MPSVTEPLVGRAAELEQLDAMLDLLHAGRPFGLTIEGEPGIGKTRLLAELGRRAEERHYIVLDGRAAEFERDLPFGVVVDAVDAYLASHEDAGLEAFPPDVRGELAAIFPSVRHPAPGALTGLGEERYRAYRAVRSLLERIAITRPLVITLDDVHWADSASIELIAALLRREPAAPVLLAMAFRPGQALERLAAAIAAPAVRRLELSPLTEAESGQLLHELDPPTRSAVYEQTGGNPFYLEQLARASGAGLSRSRAEDWTVGAAGAVPPAVAASVADELARLSDPARALLRAAAVAGEPFQPDLAAEVAEQDETEALAALDELLGLEIVRPTDVPRRFVFRHTLVRRAVYEAAPGGWRLAAHARAVAGLAARGAPAAERAHHVENAARQGDDEAIAVLLEAAETSVARAPAVAARWYEAALRLLPAGDTERRVDVQVALAAALRAGGELERCRATLIDARGQVPPEQPARRVELTAACAAVENWLGHNEQAHRRLMDAWAELPDCHSAEAAELEIELLVDGLYRLDFDQVLERGKLALETARPLGRPGLTATAAAAICFGATAAGRIGDAFRFRDEAAGLVDTLSDGELAAHVECLYYLGWAECFLERNEDATRHVERGIAISRATGDGRMLIPLLLTSASTREFEGRIGEAVELCEEAVEASRLTDNPQYLYWSLWEVGWRHYLAGNIGAAIDACEQSARSEKRLTGTYMRSGSGEPGWTLGLALIKDGQLERGYETMVRGVGPALERVTPRDRPWTYEHLALAELAMGRLEDAEAHVRKAEESADGLAPLHLPFALAARPRAELLLAAGDADGAARHAAIAVERSEAAGVRLDIAWSRLLLGRTLAAAGKRERAVASLRRAEAELDAYGSLRERDAARRELRRLGARRERRGAGGEGDGLAALTAREREIAELVTDRKTNREIAATLFVSDKTVESHLRNIFGKLGVSSRVDVARQVDRERRA